MADEDIRVDQPLLESVANGTCLPFIGAGFSLNCELADGIRMPNWNELTKNLANTIHLNENDPLEVASKYEKKYGRNQLIDSINTLLHGHKPNPGPVHNVFAKITSFDTIYTTNFDFLLEDAYKALRRDYNVIVGDKALSWHRGPNIANIIKIHGDLDHPEDLIITKNDYDQYLKTHPIMATHLAGMLITRTPLFIGYSLRDPHLRQIRGIVRERLGDFTRRGYIISLSASKEEKEKYEREGLIVISPPDNKRVYSDTLLKCINQIYNYTLTKSTERALEWTGTTEKLNKEEMMKAVTTNELKGIELASRICFVVMTRNARFGKIYSNAIQQVLSKYSLIPITYAELTSEGIKLDNAKAMLLQSTFIIFDLTEPSPDFKYLVNIALEKNKNMILLCEKGTEVPSELTNYGVTLYDLSDSGVQLLADAVELFIQKNLYIDLMNHTKEGLIQSGEAKGELRIL